MRERGLHMFRETSALTGEGVANVFADIVPLMRLTKPEPTTHRKRQQGGGGCC
jgi:hypothetical protein